MIRLDKQLLFLTHECFDDSVLHCVGFSRVAEQIFGRVDETGTVKVLGA